MYFVVKLVRPMENGVQYSAVLSHVTTERGGQCQAHAAGFVEKWDKIYSKYFNLFPVICLIYPDLLLIFTAFHIFLRLIILMYSFHDNHFYSTTIIYNSSSLFHLLKMNIEDLLLSGKICKKGSWRHLLLYPWLSFFVCLPTFWDFHL